MKEPKKKPTKLQTFFFYTAIVVFCSIMLYGVYTIYEKKRKFDACLSSIEGSDAECDSCYYRIYIDN